ncbi:MAG: hypothetical protein LBF58_00365 [Deltaproteobacteria bacterium]|jgi:hypothetical protein|nr:hypothetical protein [Deltaproteobacteria bacterium]
MERIAGTGGETETEIIGGIGLPESLEGFEGPFPYDPKHLKRLAGPLLAEAAAIARPKAAFRLALIEAEDLGCGHRVGIGPVVLENNVLADNLKDLGRAFPFVATEGPELAEWASGLGPRDKNVAFLFRYMALKEAERRLELRLTELYGLSGLGAMSPGVLPAWPLTGQKELFELLSPLPGRLGVSLNAQSFWMSPGVSSSGIYFETEAGFHNCRLCPLDACPLRRFVRDPAGAPAAPGLSG